MAQVDILSAGSPGPTPTAQDLGLESADRPRSAFRRGLEVFLENKLGVAGLIIVVAFLLFSFVGPMFYHTDQIHTSLDNVFLSPGSGHPLGTDQSGYDELGRMMKAGQSSLEVGLAAGAIASVIGTLYGAIAGYFGGFIDALMMRVLDAAFSFPLILLLIYLTTIYGEKKFTLILVIAFTGWLLLPRLVRGETLSLKTREYVQAVKVMGGSGNRIIYRHILPNAIGTIIVSVTFTIADSIFLLSSLGYLGLGLQSPDIDWGSMLNNGTNYIFDGYWWLIYTPGIAITVVVMAFNFIGDGLRDAFESRLQHR